MKTMHLIISGIVQGIGFRTWVKHQAKRLSLVGWVKNREDGAVECVVQGDNVSIQQLTMIVREGPPLAIVEGVSEEQIQDTAHYEDFIVIQ